MPYTRMIHLMEWRERRHNVAEILTKKELSKLLKVTERTIDRLREYGLPWFYVASNIRFDKEEVFIWLKGNRKENL
jgi:hypothetical protein